MFSAQPARLDLTSIYKLKVACLKRPFLLILFIMRKLTWQNFIFAFFSSALTIGTNQIAYQGARFLSRNFHHWDVALPIDYTFKPVPWTMFIYFGCFIFWFFSYFAIAMQEDREQANRFFAMVQVAKIVCFVFYLVCPTTADIRVEIVGDGWWDRVLRFCYSADSPASNYFPSMHCMASWFCFIGVRGKKQFHIAFRIATFVMAIAVFISTITTRQHVLLDIPGGIVFAELCYALSLLEPVHRTYTKIINWIMVHVFRLSGPDYQ